MRTLWSVMLVAFSAAMFGCDGRPSVTSPTPTPHIAGRVLDYQSQAPLAGARVQFYNFNPGDGPEAITDTNGVYRLPAPQPGRYNVRIADVLPGGRVFVTGPGFRGDFLVDRGTCVARYGIVVDEQTHRPVAGAVVSFNRSATRFVSGADGSYRFDLGCESRTIGFNTTFLVVEHADYALLQAGVGRGVTAVERLDLVVKAQ